MSHVAWCVRGVSQVRAGQTNSDVNANESPSVGRCVCFATVEPDVVVMISCGPAARSNATRPATPGMIIDDNDDDLFDLSATPIHVSSSCSPLSLLPSLFALSDIDHVTIQSTTLQTALSRKWQTLKPWLIGKAYVATSKSRTPGIHKARSVSWSRRTE